MGFVNSVFDSISNIAMGKLGPAANYIEKMMALTIPMLMSFLARFLGLGGIAKQIKDIIKKVKKPIDNAIEETGLTGMEFKELPITIEFSDQV